MASPAPRSAIGGLVLTGGAARRLDGAGKASVEVGGASLLDHALTALADVAEVVVAGDHLRTIRPVTFVREDPPGGGPAAGILAGLRGFSHPPELLVVLAVDMPLVTAETIERLRRAVGAPGRPGRPGRDGAILVDAAGRRQHLCAVLVTDRLVANAPARPDEHGLPVHRLYAGLDLVEVPAAGAEARDVDTWADLREVRDLFLR